MTGSGIEDSDAGSQSAEETAETESTEQTGSDFEGNTEQIETDARAGGDAESIYKTERTIYRSPCI